MSGFRYGWTHNGQVAHYVWLDNRGDPEHLTACGRRWVYLEHVGLDGHRAPEPLICDDCQRGRRPGRAA